MKLKNYRIMKKYLYLISKKCLLLAGILLLVFSSCDEEEILKEVPLDFLAPENAYASVEGIRQGIIGLHSRFRDDWYWGGQDQGSIWRGVGSDLAWHGEDPGSTRFLTNYVNYLIPASQYVLEYWNDCYTAIQRANVVIEAIENADPSIWTAENPKNVPLAEAMFFRARHYRVLVSYFGDVPLVDYVVKSAKTDFVRAPKADIYSLMEADLIFGTINLPEPGDEETGRITQGAAWHLLAETYLQQGKYQLAVDAASHVIDDYDYALMTERFGSRVGNDVLKGGDAFSDLFGYQNHNLPENTEGIWVIQVEPFITGGGNWIGERGMGPAYFRMGNTPDGVKAFRGEFVNGKYTGYSDTLGRPVAWVHPSNYAAYDVWVSDWDNDIRNAEYNIKRHFYYDAPGSAYDKQEIDWSLYAPGERDPLRDTCQYIFPYYMKFADPVNHFDQLDRSGGGHSHQDVYAIRLPETLLLRAEAYVGLGNTVLAAADINQIRNRANATPVLAADVDLDYILDEYARELYGEVDRHIILRRMGKLVERVLLYCNNPLTPGVNIQAKHVLWPIPLSQIDLNIDAVIEQNPGY